MKPNLWNLVLAAGAGRRLSSLTGGVPKQFWSFKGSPTLLDGTLQRVAPLAPADRTVIVVDRTHAPYVRSIEAAGAGHVVYQPRDRGTAAGVLLGLKEVVAHDPEVMVLLTPSDHGIARPNLFLSGVRSAVEHLDARPDDIVLFGVSPSSAEGDYGWIMPEFEHDRSQHFRSVGTFIEKPPAEVARALFDAGAVWNTMILVGRASTLLAKFEQLLPEVVAALAPTDDHSEDRASSLAASYETLRPSDFSRDLIGQAGNLTMHTWPAAMGWSDLGTPDRMHVWLEAMRPVDALVRLADLRRSGGLVAFAP